MKVLSQLLDIPSIDPDNRRRARLLNILLLGLGGLVFLALCVTIIIGITDAGNRARVMVIGQAGLVTLVGLALIFALNRYRPGWLAGSLFVLLLTCMFAFVDEPRQVVEGRTMFLFTIPIFVASVILRPWAGFAMAGVSSVVITIVAVTQLKDYAHGTPPLLTMLSFFAVALVAWLSARSLEQALEDLRVLNEELEQRVLQRTRDLAEALGKNTAILESIADGVIVFDNDGKASMVNPSLSRLLGRSPEEIKDRDIRTLMNDDVSAADQDVIIGLLKDQEKLYTGVKIEWGQHKTLSVSFAPVRAAPGNVTGTVAVFRDFTREAEIDRMKSTIVSMVSHDLRTPINAIMGYAEMLQEAVYGALSSDQLGAMDRIAANSKRLLSLVNDLLDQAQIEAGKLTLCIAPFSPSELMDSVQGILSVLLQSKDLQLICHIAEDLPPMLLGDSQRLHQIFINLANNSIKFTEQGSVTMRLYRHDPAHWALEVSDTGCGIPPDKLDRVFDRFYQVDKLETRKYTGIGLGLSIVKQLAVLMGGEVSVRSTLGAGSTFTVVLPFAPSNTQEKTL